MRVAFYLNLQGTGHCRRFESVAKHLPASFELAVVGLGKLPKIKTINRPIERIRVAGFGPPSAVPFVQAQTSYDYHDFMVNHGDNTAFTAEMVNFLSRWRPDLLVSDVGLEASILARMCGIPTIYGRQHGRRWDKGHTLAYEWACSLLAPFSAEMEQTDCPQWIREKTFYSGGFSRFSGEERTAYPPMSYASEKPNVLVMTGFGGTQITPDMIAVAAAANPQWQWNVLGMRPQHKLFQRNQLASTSRVDLSPNNLIFHGVVENVWPFLCQADLVVANGGHNSTMEIAAAKVPSICLPAERPFTEQICKANILDALDLSVVIEQWPSPSAWPQLMQAASALSPNRWDGLQDSQAPVRAANHIAEIAKRCARPEKQTKTRLLSSKNPSVSAA